MWRVQIALFLLIVCMSSASMGVHFTCKEAERNALIKFKQSFSRGFDDFILESWVEGGDCCSWAGVGCDNFTGNVIKLDLKPDARYSWSSLEAGEVSPALLELKYLTYLDLSFNSFSYSRIPEFFGEMTQLQHLDLSMAYFSGKIPQNLGNLTNLVTLDLSSNYLLMEANSLEWAFKLENLEYLGLSETNMSQALDSLDTLSNLPSLSVLNLAFCSLGNSHLALMNSTAYSNTLQQLDLHGNDFSVDLSGNGFSSSLSSWLGNQVHLTHLHLEHNHFSGSFPHFIQNLSSIQYLDLSYNQFRSSIPSWSANNKDLNVLILDGNYFSGPFPQSIQNMSSLTDLSLSYNQFHSAVPSWLSNLRNLKYLSLRDNHFNGIDGGIVNIIGHLCSLNTLNLANNQLQEGVSQSHSNISNCSTYDLEYLYLNNNSISTCLQIIGKLSSLQYLDLSHNNLETLSPSLGTLSFLYYLDLSHNHLSVVNQVSLANLSSLMYLDISSNSQLLDLDVSSDWLPPFQLLSLNMLSSKMNIPFPKWILSQKKIFELDLSDTGIFGPLPSNIGNALPSLSSLRLANNHLNGSIPTSLCELTDITTLNLQKNRLSGIIPNCWVYSSIQAVELSSNLLSGYIPNSLTMLQNLELLSLNNNSLEGELRLPLSNRVELMVLDVGMNYLHGEIPIRNGTNFPSLQILILRQNRFKGIIPPQLCSFRTLQIIDLAHNNLRGTIPQCFGHFQGMGSIEPSSASNPSPPRPTLSSAPIASPPGPTLSSDSITSPMASPPATEPSVNPDEWSAVEVIKGEEREYTTVLHLLVNMDLSCNKLVGVIPIEITTLPLLLGLNLSHNHLTGSIPNEIGNMHSLESLDFSYNNLSGSIPESISLIDSLSTMNLSFNNLQGQVPTGRHLQTLEDPSIYMGNPGLCGDPLPKCFNDSIGHSPTNTVIDNEEDNNKHEKMWFYLVIMLGFATGFWTVIGILVVQRRWRQAYFQLDEDLADWLYVRVAVWIARAKSRK